MNHGTRYKVRYRDDYGTLRQFVGVYVGTSEYGLQRDFLSEGDVTIHVRAMRIEYTEETRDPVTIPRKAGA